MGNDDIGDCMDPVVDASDEWMEKRIAQRQREGIDILDGCLRGKSLEEQKTFMQGYLVAVRYHGNCYGCSEGEERAVPQVELAGIGLQLQSEPVYTANLVDILRRLDMKAEADSIERDVAEFQRINHWDPNQKLTEDYLGVMPAEDKR